MNQRRFALVLDSFPRHVTLRVFEKAEALGIEFIPVPKEMTGEFRPLDRSCFGPVKKMSQGAWDARAAAQPNLRWHHREGVSRLEDVWPRVSRAAVLRGWDFQSEVARDSDEIEAKEDPDYQRDDPDFEFLSSAVSEASDPSELMEAYPPPLSDRIEPVIPVRGRLHDEPSVDSSSTAALLRRDERRAQRRQRQEQLAAEERLNKSFLFLLAPSEPEPPMREDSFFFHPPLPSSNEWQEWKVIPRGGKVPGPDGDCVPGRHRDSNH
jgi:hypothetical protein